MIQSHTEQAVTVSSQDGSEVAALHRALDECRKRIVRLESDLGECGEYLETEMDVVDGDYGEQAPNRAMTLVSMIDETLHGRPY